MNAPSLRIHAHKGEALYQDVSDLLLALESSDARIPLYAGVKDWCALFGVSRSTAYNLLARGAIRAKRIGGRTLIDVRHSAEWLSSQPDATFGRRAA